MSDWRDSVNMEGGWDDLTGSDGELREPFPPRKPKPSDTNTLAILAGLAALIAAIFGVGIVLTQSNRSADPTPSLTPSETVDFRETEFALELTQIALAPTITPTIDFAGTQSALSFTQTALAPTVTPTQSATSTPSNTWTASATATPTFTSTDTATATPTFTSTDTATATPTFTPSETPTFTPTPDLGVIRAENAATVLQLRSLSGLTNNILALAWSPDGTRLASGTTFQAEAPLWIWDVASEQAILKIPQHQETVTSLSWSPDGAFLASGSLDETVRISQVTSGQEILKFEGFSNAVDCVAWSPDGGHVAAISQAGEVRIWEMPRGAERLSFNLPASGEGCIAWSPNSSQIITVNKRLPLQVWDIYSGAMVYQFPGPSLNGNEVVWANGLVASRANNTLQIWDAVNIQLIEIRPPMAGSDPVWSSQHPLLVSDNNTNLYLWDMNIENAATFGSVLAQLNGHTATVSALAWSLDGRFIASGGEDRTIRIWGVPPN